MICDGMQWLRWHRKMCWAAARAGASLDDRHPEEAAAEPPRPSQGVAVARELDGAHGADHLHLPRDDACGRRGLRSEPCRPPLIHSRSGIAHPQPIASWHSRPSPIIAVRPDTVMSSPLPSLVVAVPPDTVTSSRLTTSEALVCSISHTISNSTLRLTLPALVTLWLIMRSHPRVARFAYI